MEIKEIQYKFQKLFTKLTLNQRFAWFLFRSELTIILELTSCRTGIFEDASAKRHVHVKKNYPGFQISKKRYLKLLLSYNFDPLHKFFIFCAKSFIFDQTYLNTGSKTQNVEKLRLDLIFHNHF